MGRTKMIDSIKNIVKKIKKRSLRLVVIGAGYVGLPTAALFAEAGFRVTVIDIKSEIINNINLGYSHVTEPGLKDLIYRNVKAGRLKGQLDYPNFAEIDIILIAVQTPINEKKKPCLNYLMNVLDSIGKKIKPGMVLILNSTIPPKTMMHEVKSKIESLSGLKSEIDFYMAYVPERIAPGKAIKEFMGGTRLVGGVGKNSTRIVAELFKTVCKEVIETDASTAEIAKLAENTYRDVNIAFANELALICEKLGVDVLSMIKLANSHPRVNIHLPGPGVGGPCLPKDPYLLLNSLDLPKDIIKAARNVNDYMSQHTVQLILQALKNVDKDVVSSKITILGIAYKRDTDDSRLSPAESIIRRILDLGAEVNVYDSWCKESFGATQKNSLDEAVKGADCLVTITNHSDFSNLNLKKIKKLMNYKPIIIDGRRIIDPDLALKLNFFYYGIGLGISDNNLI